MQRWEYTSYFRQLSDWPERELNEMGAQGWELIYVHHGAQFYRYIFKRPKYVTEPA